MELRVSPEHLDGQAAASSLAEAASGSKSSVSVCVDATGPFAVTPRASALRRSVSLVAEGEDIRYSRLIECWLGAEGMDVARSGSARSASSLVSFSAEGDEIDAVAAATLGRSLAVCARLETVRIRAQLAGAGAEALSHESRCVCGSDIFDALAVRTGGRRRQCRREGASCLPHDARPFEQRNHRARSGTSRSCVARWQNTESRTSEHQRERRRTRRRRGSLRRYRRERS